MYFDGMQEEVESGRLDPLTSPLHVMLVLADEPIYPWMSLDDIRAIEAKGKGYTRGGKPLEGKRVIEDDKIILMADDLTWPNSTITASGYALYEKAPFFSRRQSRLIGHIPFDGLQWSRVGNYTLWWYPLDGVWSFSAKSLEMAHA